MNNGAGNPLGKSTHPADEPDSDAKLSFSLTEDRMAAFISSYEPPTGEGKPLSIMLMEKELKRAGYGGQLDHDAAMFALKRLSEGKSILNVALVRGAYPQEPEDGSIYCEGNLNYPVVPGLVFGKLMPPVKGRPGMTIDGEEIKPQSSKDLDPETGELVAERYGLVRVREGKISVDSLIEVSSDYMSVKAYLYGFDCFGSHISLRQIEHSLKELNITRPIRHMAGEAALKKARETAAVQEAVIAKGTEPVAGKDGWFEYAHDEVNTVGTALEGDRVDYRERGTHPMVKPGDIIGKIHPPVEGKAGEDVFGRLTPPPGGNPFEVTPGESVVPLADGITYKASATGIVHLENGELSVCDVLVTKGDVDYSTGNIRLESGSVHVTGNVREGFTIEAPEHVTVKETIEGSHVTAGKDIEVSGGIVMNDKGLVKSGGNVIAQFAANARIESGDEVIIAREISNCLIKSKGPVQATSGKGVIQGGTIASATGIEANELGSEIGVKTVVAILTSPPNNKELIEKREALRAKLLKINKSIGEEPDELILSRTPENKQEMMEKVLLARAQTRMKLKEIRRKINAELGAYYQNLERLSIRARRVVYPGVIIRIGGKSYQVDEPMHRVRFYFEAASKSIVAGDF